MIRGSTDRVDQLAEQSLLLAEKKLGEKDFHAALVMARKVSSLLADAPFSNHREVYRVKYLEIMGDAYFGLFTYDEALLKYEEALGVATKAGQMESKDTVRVLFKLERALNVVCQGSGSSKPQQQLQRKRWKTTPALAESMRQATPQQRKLEGYGIKRKPKAGEGPQVEEKKESDVAGQTENLVLQMVSRAMQLLSLPIFIVIMIVQLQTMLTSDLSDLEEQAEGTAFDRGAILSHYIYQCYEKKVFFQQLDRDEKLRVIGQHEMELSRPGAEAIKLTYTVQDPNLFSVFGVWAASTFQKTTFLKPNGYGLMNLGDQEIYLASDSEEYALASEMTRLAKSYSKTRGTNAAYVYSNPFTKKNDKAFVIPVEDPQLNLYTDVPLTKKVTREDRWNPGTVIVLEGPNRNSAVYYGIDRAYRLLPYRANASGKPGVNLIAQKQPVPIVVYSAPSSVITYGGTVCCALLATAFAGLTFFSRLLTVKLIGLILCMLSAAAMMVSMLNQGFVKF